ncbi:MAG TPA: hypothetical protein VMX55_06795 [candidate division Zixibacteria bacterium]|nr:hypothetical protein [candidate division Zixibacteria bacterium]
MSNNENNENQTIIANKYTVPGALDVIYTNNLMYILENHRISIYQLNNLNPAILIGQSNASEYNFLQFRINNIRAYILDEYSRILIYDLTNLENITQIDIIYFQPYQVNQFDVYNNSLFVIVDIGYGGGLANIDLSNLSDIGVIYYYLPEFHNFVDFSIYNHYLYILDQEFFITVLDLNNNTHANATQIYFRQSQYLKIHVEEDFIYVIEEPNIFTIVRMNNFHISNVDSSIELEILSVREMVFKPGYAFFIDFDSIEVVKTTISTVPTSYGKKLIDSYSYGFNSMILINNYLYIARNYYNSENIMIAVDVTIPSDLQVLWPKQLIEESNGNENTKQLFITIGILVGMIIVIEGLTFLTLFLINKRPQISEELEEKQTEQKEKIDQ